MAKSSYIMRTTSGGEVAYSLKTMLEITRKYLEQCASNTSIITEKDCLNEIDDFVSRFKLVDNKD